MESSLRLERFLLQAGLEHGTARSGPGCSKVTVLFVNVLLKFQTLISNIRQYFLLNKRAMMALGRSPEYHWNQLFQNLSPGLAEEVV